MKFSRTYRLASRRLERRRTKFRQRKPGSNPGISRAIKEGLRRERNQKSRKHIVLKSGTSQRARSRSPRRIGKHWNGKPDVIVYPDGREVCNPATPGGRAEYKYRTVLMWLCQDGWCCNCPYRLSLSEATFEHEDGRTKARRDDRIAIFDAEGNFIRRINGASHADCNAKRGSRHTPIWHGNNCVIEREVFNAG